MKPEEIKAYRLALGLTQVQLAEKLGKSVNEIEHWESGRFKPESQKILQLAFKGLETEIRDKKVPTEIKKIKRELYHGIKKTDKLLGLPERDLEFLL